MHPESRRGVASSLPVAFVRPPDAALGEVDYSLWISPAGTQPAFKVTGTLIAQHPNFGTVFDFPGYPGVEIDAFSSGNDYIGATSNGAPNLNMPARWQAVSVAVDKNATGLPNGILSGPSLADPRGAIISYYMEEAHHFPETLEDSVYVEQLARHVWGSALPSDPSYVDYDFGLACLALAADPNGGGSPVTFVFQHGLERVFFSVTSEWAAVNQGFVQNPPEPINGATIFERTWNGTSWNAPTVWKESTTLGSNSAEDVDALMVDANANPPKVVYSTVDPTPEQTELRLYDGANGQEQGRAYLASGTLTPVVERLTLGPDDKTTGGCIVDPGSDPGQIDEGLVGMPRSPRNALTGAGLSMVRTVDPVAGPLLVVQQTGHGGLDNAALLYAALYVDTVLYPNLVAYDPYLMQCEWRIPLLNATSNLSIQLDVAIIDVAAPGYPTRYSWSSLLK